ISVCEPRGNFRLRTRGRTSATGTGSSSVRRWGLRDSFRPSRAATHLCTSLSRLMPRNAYAGVAKVQPRIALIVSPAAQPEVLERALTTHRKRIDVVELEAPPRAAPPPHLSRHNCTVSHLAETPPAPPRPGSSASVSEWRSARIFRARARRDGLRRVDRASEDGPRRKQGAE